MENLNAEQIKKALECCTDADQVCDDCILCEDRHCGVHILKYALALITSQEQRIKELAEENERLRAQNERYAELEQGCYVTGYKNIKADTVREMQERLKQRKVCYGNITFKVVPIDEIDQIAKEMLEGDK